MLTDTPDPADKPEREATAAGEDNTTVVPKTEEETSEPTGEKPTGEGAGAGEDDKKSPVEEFEVFLDGEDEAPDAAVPKDSAAWARMRQAEREAKAKAAALERELQALRQPAGAVDPGPEPTSEDVAYDEAELKKRLRQWDKDMAAFEAAKGEQARLEDVRKRENQNRVNAYNVARTEALVKFPGYAASEEAVGKTLSADRLEVLVKNAGSLSRVISLLGQRPELLEKFAKETDRDRFVSELAKLEVSMKERKKGTPPPPERTPRGNGAPAGGNVPLDKLREKAEQTGDYSEVNAWKRKHPAKK